MTEPLLDIRGLKTHFATDDGIVHAVDGVDLAIGRGETVGVVGESGCGKTITAMSVLKLIPMPPGRIVAGQILWKGRDLVPLDADAMRRIRSKEIAIVFQEPMTSLNPVYTIGDQIAEVIRLHEGLSRRGALDKTVEMLRLVNIPNPERRVRDYPHQFSGGMRQRVMIAMALINDPDLLIADEPTTALDVTTQAQILSLMKTLQEDFGSAIIMITHDLGVVAEIADDVLVMYAANVVEQATVYDLFSQPQHPYTWGLMGSLPRLEADVERLTQIPGQPPSLLRPPSGCRFHPRCPYVMEVCKTTVPALAPTSRDPDHLQKCHLDEETKEREAAKLLAATMAEAG
ncbi:MAG: ABC transporter ATP-binding protein [Microvirga sp.]